MQDVLAITAVFAALAWVVYHLVLKPAFRDRRPDVPVKNLVRKKRPRGGDCCH